MDERYARHMFGLGGRVALVTGGAGALCAPVSAALARMGARVAVLDLNRPAAESVSALIESQGGQAMAMQGDVQDRESLERALEQISRRFGPVDILINGVGGNRKAAATALDRQLFDLPLEAIE